MGGEEGRNYKVCEIFFSSTEVATSVLFSSSHSSWMLSDLSQDSRGWRRHSLSLPLSLLLASVWISSHPHSLVFSHSPPPAVCLSAISTPFHPIPPPHLPTCGPSQLLSSLLSLTGILSALLFSHAMSLGLIINPSLSSGNENLKLMGLKRTGKGHWLSACPAEGHLEGHSPIRQHSQRCRWVCWVREHGWPGQTHTH